MNAPHATSPETNSRRVRVRLFAGAVELAGQRVLELPLTGDSTVADLRQQLILEHERLSDLAAISRFAVDAEFVSEDYRLDDVDEIALIPPVSGG